MFAAGYIKKCARYELDSILHACVTGWIRYSERVLGSLVTPHICTARSPQQIMGCLVKDFFCKQQVGVRFTHLHWSVYYLFVVRKRQTLSCYHNSIC